MSLWREYRHLHRWLLAVAGVLAAFYLARGSRPLMNALARYVTQPLKRGLAAVSYLTSVSLAEVWYFVLAAALFFYLTWAVRQILRRKRKWRSVYGFAMGLVCAGLTVWAAFCLLWGVNYYTDSFQQQSGVYAKGATVEELRQVTAYFAGQLSASSETVSRDENGLFAVSRQEILSQATAVYPNSYEAFPTLRMTDRAPKAVNMSGVMSAMDFTGFYFPFTGEANVNMDSPAAFLPATAAHEMAHERGISSEQECNFIAIVTSTTCGIPSYVYSGWLLGYIHLGNALFEADRDAWQEIRDSLPENVIKDMEENNAYWAAWKGTVSAATSKAYDSLLKGYGETAGIQSYGTVVDMLVAYYG